MMNTTKHTVKCLKCDKPLDYRVGTCPHCGYVEFRDTRTLTQLVDAAIASVYIHDVQRFHTVFPPCHYESANAYIPEVSL